MGDSQKRVNWGESLQQGDVADRVAIPKLKAEMARIHNSRLSEGESDNFLPSVRNGNGLQALLAHRYEEVGDAETQKALGAGNTEGADSHSISYYHGLLDEAAAALDLTPEHLQALHKSMQSQNVKGG